MTHQRRQNASLPAPQLRRRVLALRRRVGTWKADALLITNAHDIRYLTGFIGDDSWALVPARAGGIVIFSDFRFKEQIQREAPHVRAVMRKKALAVELARVADRRRYRKIALQAEYVTLGQRKSLVKQLGARRLVAVEDALGEQRIVKDEKEVAAICRALGITQQAFMRTLSFVEPGQSEYEVAAYLEYQMRRLGADGASFPSIVAVDANASLPHAIPGRRKVRRGGMILFDWGAMANGYCADLTRVVSLGKMKPIIREIYTVVLAAHDAAIEAVTPGKAFSDVDAVARDLIKKAGYADQFGHSLGHGLGLFVHEAPRLSEQGEGRLREGHVVTVEPGIYLPGVGGVRIEDDVLVTAHGHRVLSSLPTDLKSAII